jgi:putative membrane-bound dehydrogenase-like protein
MRKTILWLFIPLSLLVGLSLAIPFNGDPEEEKRKPENAVKNLKVADGLQAQLFASEPMMTNPTNMDIDDRGRVWVCEAYNYRPEINGNPVKKEGDRILILEDTNGDGAADKNTVFYQGPEIESPLGIWVMGNRAIVSQSPYLWLFTDDNGDDRADRKEVILQGISGKQHDHGLHAVVFGPDGKWYFNFGNDGRTLQDKNGQTVKTREGTEISLKNYKQGMVFRCDPDFTNFEVLGHNFRNNYEVALDSYGTMWQSDNDDDGNKGVRINYVMDFGNYGYTDEMTGAGWQVNRTNLEVEIPHRHWHLNDPGVVPNLLQTGAGSPCGMVVYEGTLLPEVFRGQPIHADAGPNVVRAYPKVSDGAGYKAQIVNILEGVGDQWFRPCDVCVAPDGSLFAADWYDPGVGGHNAGDQNRGRVFRVAPASAAAYKVPKFDYSTPESALAALRNANLSVRWKAWQALHNMGATAEAALTKVANNDPVPEQRARALWLLVKGANGAAHVQRAAADADPNIRMVAIRAARQGAAPLMPLLAKLAQDPDPQVRRECALALHHNNAPEVPAIWTTLARQHNGRDRWYLEALGIAAADQWDRCFAAWLQAVGDQATATAANQDIVWRARCAAAAPLLGKLAGDAKTALSARLRYFRAFDFIKDASKSTVLLQLVRDNSAQPDVVKLALRHLDADFVKTNPEAKTALLGLMKNLQGTEYIEFAERYALPEENTRLYNMAVKGDYASKAADILLRNPAGLAMLTQTLKNKKQDEAGIALLKALSRAGGKTQLDLLKAAAFDKKRSETFRKKAYEYLGGSWGGEDLVLSLLRSNGIDKKYIPAAVQGVSNAWRLPVRLESQQYLGKSTADAKMPDVAVLTKRTGDVTSGAKLFETNCANCHVVNGQGIDYGPKLSEIGSKLSKEAQYLAILHPSAGISFGYEGWNIKLKDGSLITGIIASQTEMEMVVKMPGGTTQTYAMKDVVSKKQMSQSLMPEGFHIAMNEGQLVDLVEYLMSLKRK